MSNRNLKALQEFVDRGFAVEDEFRNAKTERDDLMRDLKAEIKARNDETGVDAKEVVRLIKIRLDESAERERMQLLCGDIETFDTIFGPPSRKPAQEDEDI